MAYQHGISVIEQKSVGQPSRSLSAVQVVIGTAPVHLIADPASAVNNPILANTLEDVKAKLGYSGSESDDFDKYTLNESVFSSFELFNVAPIVFINVLDPEIHKTDVTDQTVAITKGVATIDDDGVLLDSVQVKSTDKVTTYVKNTDYTLAFDEKGKPVIAVLSSGTVGTATELSVSFSKLNPEAVIDEEIIGGYDSETGKYSGSELVRNVYPQFGILPALVLAPGWSHKPEIAAVLNAKLPNINGSFKAFAVLDVDSETVRKYGDVPTWKTDNNYTDKRSIVLWPKVKKKGKILWYSAVMAARIAQTDAENEDVPFVSPSNKEIPIDATVLADGTNVFLDQPQANYLNGKGIVTAINWGTWRTWGNNTAAYPEATKQQDRFIAVRRVFDWWGNSFIVAFFDKVDNPTNYRLIESVVDAENLRANGYQAKGQIAGAKIEFREDMNPAENILNGKIVFTQKIGAFSPAESIVNVLEFDPTITAKAILGGA
ncbi:phage tail protein [Bacillaceae bacterium SAOS 7]|nr:phage tail protein [Bacillaceae bacterium SAOS 7]